MADISAVFKSQRATRKTRKMRRREEINEATPKRVIIREVQQ